MKFFRIVWIVIVLLVLLSVGGIIFGNILYNPILREEPSKRYIGFHDHRL